MLRTLRQYDAPALFLEVDIYLVEQFKINDGIEINAIYLKKKHREAVNVSKLS